MKRMLVLMVLLALLVQPGLASTQAVPAPEVMDPVAREVVAADGLVAPGPGAAKTFAQGQPEPQAGGMPGWPIPERPIPHHEPGHPSKATDYTTQVTRLNVEGVEETVQLSGIDAMLADGRMDDPLQGNYRLANLDKLMWASYHDLNYLTLQTFELVTPTLRAIGGSWAQKGNHRFYDIAAGDLNGDLQDEQITAWIGGGNQIYLSLGEMPGSLGRVTSAPAAVSSNGELDLVVRGYDDALWYHDGASWQNAGGRLLSGPAVASRAAGQFDAFAAGLNDSVEPNYLVVRHNQWDGANWAGWEALDDPDEGSPPSVWPTVERNVPTPEFPAPAVVTNGSSQLDLFWLWPDNTLRWRHLDGTVWDPWVNLGGMLASGPGAVAHDGQIDVFARGVDDALWTRTYSSSWGAWQRIDRAGMPSGVTIASAPAAVSPAAGQVLVTVRGSDDRLWQLAYDGSSWGDWHLAGLDKSTSGQAGQALGLDGVNDYVDLPDNFSNVTDFTFAAWVYWEGGGNFQRIFDFGQDTNSYMFLTPSEGTNMRFTIRTGGGAEQRLNAATPITQTEWVHVAVTLDGSTGVLYINGSAVDTQPITLTPRDVVGENTWLGRSQYAADPTFNGSIDEVVVFDQALSASEIADIYDTGWGSLSGKVLALHLDENPATHGTTLIDASGSGNDGTLYTFGSSKLAAAPAVVAHGGQIDLFARTRDGHLGHALYDGSTWTDWTNFEGLGVGAVYPTGAVAANVGGNATLENLLLDVETGYFTGDGREQIVLGYESGFHEIKIELYDIHDGFVPLKTAELTAPITGFSVRITAADVDGDGTDEIGIAHLVIGAYNYKVEVYDVKEVAGSWTRELVKLPNESPRFYTCSGGCGDTDDDAHWFAGTLRITSGDFVAEAPGQNPNDEIAVLSDWGDSRVDEDYDLWVQLYILDNDYDTPITDCMPETHPNCPMADMWRADSDDDNFWDNGYATGVGLAAGDVDGDGYDEIVLTWPGRFDGEDWPDLVRYLRILNARNVDPIGATPSERKPTVLAEYSIPGYQRYSYLDTLAVGDLDSDLRDEIVFYQHDQLEFYEYNTLARELELRSTIPSASGDFPKVSLVMGDFTGESVRVGPPAYRVQRNMVSPIAFVNMPPKHRDLLKGTDGYTRMEISDDAYAVHVSQSGVITQSTITSKKDWALSSGLEMGAGAMGHKVTTSFEHTYGRNFEASHGTITTARYEDTTTADVSDQILYNGTNYAVWEYPVYGVQGAGGEASTISVIFPLDADLRPATQTNDATTLRGDYPQCTDPFYAPSHQPYNLWSYEALGSTPGFRDYQGGVLLWQKQTTGGTDIAYDMGATTKEQRTSSFHHRFQTGLEYSYEGGLSIPLVGKVLDFSFRAYVNGDYGSEQIETFETELIKETSVGVNFPSVPNAVDAYDLKAYLYWSPEDYLVLDYQTDPGGGLLLKYNKPDPAFILPWYGFPDPDDPIGPPCGDDMKYYSGDVVVHPPFAHVGETVTITATVRNFSPVEACGVQVAFYRGDPAGGRLIEKKDLTLPSTYPGGCLNRAGGPVPVSVSWTVPDADVERIYAVIDPDDTLDPEVHDEDDLTVDDGQVVGINNNMGFGLIHVGGADYVDPGTAEEKAYDPVDLSLSPSLTITAFIPTGNHTVTARYELKAFPIEGVSAIGVPFRLDAYMGKEEPESGLQLKPVPGVIAISYADTDIIGKDEANLTLFRRLTNGHIWEEATCLGYQIHRFPEDNLVAVPVCQTGTFVLSDEAPRSFVYLPAVFRNY